MITPTIMTTTIISSPKEVVGGWAEDLQKMGFKRGWMLVVYDLHSGLDRPEYIPENEDVREAVREYARVGAEEVLEIYALSQPIGPQLEQAKAWNW
jgi:hypothetical protein